MYIIFVWCGLFSVFGSGCLFCGVVVHGFEKSKVQGLGFEALDSLGKLQAYTSEQRRKTVAANMHMMHTQRNCRALSKLKYIPLVGAWGLSKLCCIWSL